MPARARRASTAGGGAPATSLALIRNIGIMAHVDAGKTTTTERLLYYAGATRRIGEVEDGSTVTDWMLQEQERGISIVAAAITLAWRGRAVNLIDTPGHVDFTMEVERSLRVLDGAIAVFDAVAGVEPQSETVWRQADKYGVPRLAFVNKCDREGADPVAVMAAMRVRLGAHPVALQVPWHDDGEFVGVVDVVAMRARRWDADPTGATCVESELDALPAGLAVAARAAREALLEALAEVDETVLAAYVGGGVVEGDTVRTALRAATIAGQVVPVLCGAARRNRGVLELLDAIVDYLPAPDEVAATAAHDEAGAPLTVEARADAPLAALTFKVQAGTDRAEPVDASRRMPPRAAYVRVYAGRLRAGDVVWNATRDRHLEIGELVRFLGNRREAVPELSAGMIGAVVGERGLGTGDTLCDPSRRLRLGTIHVPDAVVGVIVVPETNEDHARLEAALAQLADEDPSFRVRVDEETGQTLLSGMGELHLEILLDRLRREFGVTARAGRPQVAYRETVTRRAEAEERFVRSDPGRYGHVRLSVEPADRGRGVQFASSAPHDQIPREYVPAVRAGVTDALARGVVMGYPLTDLRVEVLGGSHHPVDSSASAFQVAGALALTAAASSAAPVVLEPVMAVEVVTPDDVVGDVLGDLHARRGKIAGISARPGVQTVASYVPLSSMFGYASDLRSRTRGRATYSMEFQTYTEVAQTLVTSRR